MSKKARILIFSAELVAGFIFGLIMSAFVLPLCYTERGYFAIGAEWFLILFAAYAGFTAANKYIFERIERSIGWLISTNVQFAEHTLTPVRFATVKTRKRR